MILIHFTISLKSGGAIEFTGLEDYLIADEWIMHIENVFKTMQCTSRQKVALAASMFRDIANTWWKSVCLSYRTIAEADAWSTFEKQFRKKFNPTHVTRQKKS